MRLFELLAVLSAAASAVSLTFPSFPSSPFSRQKKLTRDRRAGASRILLIFPALSILFCILNFIFEGFRVQMLPAYLFSLILFAAGWIRAYKKKTADTRGVRTVRRGKKIWKAAGIFFLYLLLIVSAAFPALFPVVSLPAPGGKYPVGTMNLSFSDSSRKGVFTSPDQARNIAVQVFYPAGNENGKETARFFSDKRLSSSLAQSMRMPDLFSHISLVKTHSRIGAEISGKEDKYPVLLFSSGYMGFTGQNTVLLESLASRGYVVFAVSHPYEDFAVLYPDGELVPYSTPQTDALQNELIRLVKEYPGNTSSPDFEKYQAKNAKISDKSVRIWSKDIEFVANEIEKLGQGKTKSIFENKLDTSAMGVFGHSFGGAAAGQACLEDERFRGFINMDGAPFGDSVTNVIKQPFMILKGEAHRNFIEAGYAPGQNNYIDVTINGAKHIDFTDFTLLLPVFRSMGILGSIGGDRQEEILKDYTAAFFDKYLKNEQEPLIDKDLHKYSEVTVELK